MYPDIYGESLYTLMMNNPDKLDEYMDKLIKIQTNIHSKKCPYLPIQKQKLTDYINSAHLDRYLKLDLLDMLNSSPKHKKLCHGNLTPHNIIIKDDNIYVTDWNHASQGNASADVPVHIYGCLLTCLIMQKTTLNDSVMKQIQVQSMFITGFQLLPQQDVQKTFRKK